jgi:heme exporter protein A
VALARLLISSAKIWFLDEPFTALDNQGVKLIEECMQGHVDVGGSVVLSTHQPIAMNAVRHYSLVDQSSRGVN